MEYPFIQNFIRNRFPNELLFDDAFTIPIMVYSNQITNNKTTLYSNKIGYCKNYKITTDQSKACGINMI